MSLQEGFDKVRNLRASKIPSQQRQVALLDGVDAMLREEGQTISPTAYFATLLSLLERADAAEPATELLAIVVPFVPQSLLASKIDVTVAKLLPVLLNEATDGTALVRSSIAVLEAILKSVDAVAWRVPLVELGAPLTFSGLLALARDSRPKVRRRAVEAVEAILEEGKGGKKLAFEAALTAVREASDTQKIVHALQLLKAVVSYIGSALTTIQIEELTSILLEIARGNEQHAIVAALAVLGKVPMQNDPRAVETLLGLAPNGSDKQLAPVWLAVLAQAAPPILSCIGAIITYLSSDHREVVESAGQCLIAHISESFDREDMATAKVIASDYLFPLLQAKYHSAWPAVCEVCAAFIAVLPYELAPKVEGVLNIVRVVGALRTATNEADQVLGAAIRVLGPRVVCEVVPLQLDPRNGNGRAWMLPLLAEHTSHTELSFYFESLVPLAQDFEAVAGDLAESRRTKILETIAEQLYTLFPKFCKEAVDIMTTEQVQEVLGWLYSRVQLRPCVCLGLKLYVDSANMSQQFVEKYGSDILNALWNVFQSMIPDSRGYVLETVDAFLKVLPSNEVFQLFNQVSTLLAQSLTDSDARHTMMDIINAIVPYLTDENGETSQILINMFKAVGAVNDALMQKKAYRALFLYKPEINNDMLAELLLSMQDSVQATARRTRLQAVSRVINAISTNGDFSFVFKVIPEAILGVKDPNEKTREAAFDLLVLCGKRMQESEAHGAFVDHGKIAELRDDDSKAPVSIEAYFEMVMAGLAGSTPHMVAATVTALARVLFEFHSELQSEKLKEYIDLVWMLLESPSREIVGAVFGFVKVSVLMMPTEELNEKLPQLLTLILAWSNEHKNHFKTKVRHLVERLLRRCGYEALDAAFPESDKKLLNNIYKSKERARRKRSQASKEGAFEPSAPVIEKKFTRKYDNVFDQALYGSDSESESDGETETVSGNLKNGGNKKQGNARTQQFIIGDEDPLDLLGENALAHISSTKPEALRERKMAHQLPQSKDGRLVIGRNEEAQREESTKNALSAYMDAVKSGPVRTQSGKLKFKRGKRAHQEDDDDGPDEKPLKLKFNKGGKVAKASGAKKHHMQKRRRL